MASAKKKLLIPSNMSRKGWAVLGGRSDIEAIAFDMTIASAEFHALLRDADGVALSLTRFGEAELQAGPNVRAVARHGVGYDMVDVAACTRHRVPLFVTGTANSPSVAEHALSFMLALAKRTEPLNAMVRERRWAQRLAEPLPIDLFGKTLLVVGFGRIGTRIAKACVALGMAVRVYDPYVPASAVSAAGCIAEVDLDAALPQADFVTIHCPKTPETTNMFDATRLASMKSSAYLINTARGGIIDEAALQVALTEGRISGAGLDVFEREPPADDNPLLSNPKVIAAPHMAGVTREAMDRMAIAVAENLLSVIDGKPKLENVVNPEVFGHR
ncbi:MAG TPA: hydroxyacid dehydrogenase [Burkholderiales bacterium]|nr:hydroxyacid dehydrogenase [Burkholderiales bacterium]